MNAIQEGTLLLCGAELGVGGGGSTAALVVQPTQPPPPKRATPPGFWLGVGGLAFLSLKTRGTKRTAENARNYQRALEQVARERKRKR